MSTALALAAPLDLWDPNTFEQAQRIGKMFASSVLIPEHLRGKLPDVTIALMMARRLGEDPLIVMQNIHVVSGKAGWSAQYIIARTNRSGVFKGRINWREEGRGDGLAVTAFAVLADTGEEVSFTASMQMAKDEGWTKNPKYRSMPQLMLRYRSATFLVRLYAPEVMLGVPTIEEVEDVAAAQPARVVLQAAHVIPALEDTGTRAGQLAALLDDEDAASSPVVQPAPQQGPASPPPTPPRESAPAPQAAPKPPPADPARDGAALRSALQMLGTQGRIPHEIARKHLREALGLARIGDDRYRAAVDHGRMGGWWRFDEGGLTMGDGVTTGVAPAADRWAGLTGDALLAAIEDLAGRLGDELNEEAMRKAELADVQIDTATDDELRRLGRELDRIDAQLRAADGE
jgi:hypothetical protein